MRRRRHRPWYDFRVRAFYRLMRGRWTAKMPKLFKSISLVCGFVSGAALAVNTAMEVGHASAPAWWDRIYAFLLGAPALVMFTLKFTRDYDADGIPMRGNKKSKI
ncbi:MAG: hypothetical protein MSD82_12360 [Prevotella sp.]|nr:hypothetical protein [Prevotella sp.]